LTVSVKGATGLNKSGKKKKIIIASAVVLAVAVLGVFCALGRHLGE